MNAFAIRNVTGQYAGEWFTLARLDTRAEHEAWIETLDDPDAFEVVELDDNGQVIERG